MTLTRKQKGWIAVGVGAGVSVAGFLFGKNANAGQLTQLQQAAVAMAQALAAHNYVASDVPIYKAFQTAANITVDGWPGPNTMSALATALNGTGTSIPSSVTVYPFTSWGPPNGPTWAQWSGGSNATASAIGQGDAANSVSGAAA